MLNRMQDYKNLKFLFCVSPALIVIEVSLVELTPNYRNKQIIKITMTSNKSGKNVKPRYQRKTDRHLTHRSLGGSLTGVLSNASVIIFRSANCYIVLGTTSFPEHFPPPSANGFELGWYL